MSSIGLKSYSMIGLSQSKKKLKDKDFGRLERQHLAGIASAKTLKIVIPTDVN